MKKKLLSAAFLMSAWGAYAQVGIGTQTPNKSAQLEVVARNKGIWIPQVSLKGTLDQATISNGNVESLLVFNTSSIADMSSGYYYWCQNKWRKIVDADSIIESDRNTTNTIFKVENEDLVLTDSDGSSLTVSLTDLNKVTMLTSLGNGVYK